MGFIDKGTDLCFENTYKHAILNNIACRSFFYTDYEHSSLLKDGVYKENVTTGHAIIARREKSIASVRSLSEDKQIAEHLARFFRDLKIFPQNVTIIQKKKKHSRNSSVSLINSTFQTLLMQTKSCK